MGLGLEEPVESPKPVRRRLRTKVSIGFTKPQLSCKRGPLQVCTASIADVGQSTAASSSTGSAVRWRGPYEIAERGCDYVIVRSGLSKIQLQKLEEFLKTKRPRAAKMKNEGCDSDDERKARYDDRDSKVSWFNGQREIPWLQHALADVVKQVANAEWPILPTASDGRLKCEFEDMQYAVYGENQHFKAWHQDAFELGNDPEDARQITIVLMISPKENYRGGRLQAKVPGPAGRKVIRHLELDAGDMAVFPAKKLMHRVTEVKSGLRKTLVFWAYDRASCRHGRKLLGLPEQTPETPES